VNGPDRVSLNFVDRCNMSCRFCYIPFDGMAPDRKQALSVVDTVLSWGIGSITIGGGDPLMYPWFGDVLRRINESRPDLFVQVDTNLLTAGVAALSELRHMEHMLGIPLDTLRPDVAFAMRRNRRHPAVVVDRVREAVRAGFCVKINTVVSRLNVDDLRDLATYISDSKVALWSLYEFWPIGERAILNAPQLSLTHEEYRAAVDGVSTRCAPAEVEAGSIEDRRGAYFFVTPTGRAYTVDASSASTYRELGNILTEEGAVIERWHAHCDALGNALRYKTRKDISRSRVVTDDGVVDGGGPRENVSVG
jgi:MoaA/NifB/PqqE/SkfB family radical SAM enzyme